MTPTNLPDLYSRVVAKRPELAVERLRTLEVLIPKSTQTVSWWYCWRGVGSGTAAALILAKWVEALPVGKELYHAENYDNGEPRWWVGATASEPTPLEALAAFWLEYNP
jgi:hypothetical protein